MAQLVYTLAVPKESKERVIKALSISTKRSQQWKLFQFEVPNLKTGVTLESLMQLTDELVELVNLTEVTTNNCFDAVCFIPFHPCAFHRV